MGNISWLTQEAQRIHAYFGSIFYLFVTVLLVVGVFIEYFRFPLGQIPSFGVLLGRAFIAIFLLTTYNEVTNHFATISDSLAQGIGGFDSLEGVLQKMGEKVDNYSEEWLSARSLVMTVLSILTYTFLFYSVIIAEAAHVFTWTLLFVFSPILIALFVLPATSSATKALYRSLIEVCCWKIVWATLASLLWSSVLVDMNNGTTIDFIKMICINLILGASLLATPWIVHALATSGLSGFTRNFSGVMTAAGFMTPLKAAASMNRVRQKVSNVYGGAKGFMQQSAKATLASGSKVKAKGEKVKDAVKVAAKKLTTPLTNRSTKNAPTTARRLSSSQIRNTPIEPTNKRH